MITDSDVMMWAMKSIHELAPAARCQRDGLAIRIEHQGRTLVWNLHDVARLAPSDAAWRDGVRTLARKVLASQPAERGAGLIQARLRSESKLPHDVLTGDFAVERVVGDLFVLYGSSIGDRFSICTWADIPDRASNRTLAAAVTLGDDFTPGHMMSPVTDDLPVFTNEEAHPNVAAALLMPPKWWTIVMSAFTPPPPALLVAVPTPSRIFVGLDVAPEMLAIMKTLVESALQIEDDVLSTSVFRFDGATWTVA